MKRNVLLVLSGIVLLSAPLLLAAAEVDTKGATPGKWTMDLDAARKLATDKKLPILLNFSGSDWCGWCKLMEKDVFSKPDWKTYAKDNLLMVLIDFPKDTTIVPAAYAKRNEELKTKYAVEGFPTFIVLDDDAETELGRLGAGRDKTPGIFIQELRPLFRHRPAELARYAKALDPKAKAAYLTIIEQIAESKKTIKRCEQEVSAAERKIKETEKKLAEQESSAQEFRAAQLGENELKQYKKLKSDLETAQKALTDWMSTEPERSEENMKKYQSMAATIQELSGKLSQY